MKLPLYATVYCVQTAQRAPLFAQTDTAALRASFTFVAVVGERVQIVVPCAGFGCKVPAYWRGLPGNDTRATELVRQVKANGKLVVRSLFDEEDDLT